MGGSAPPPRKLLKKVDQNFSRGGHKNFLVFFFLHRCATELSAGCVDVGAELATYRCANALGFKRLGKCRNRRLVRLLKSRLCYLVYGNKVDVYGHCFGARAQMRVEDLC